MLPLRLLTSKMIALLTVATVSLVGLVGCEAQRARTASLYELCSADFDDTSSARYEEIRSRGGCPDDSQYEQTHERYHNRRLAERDRDADRDSNNDDNDQTATSLSLLGRSMGLLAPGAARTPQYSIPSAPHESSSARAFSSPSSPDYPPDARVAASEHIHVDRTSCVHLSPVQGEIVYNVENTCPDHIYILLWRASDNGLTTLHLGPFQADRRTTGGRIGRYQACQGSDSTACS
jgi:hypothetical protein